MNCYCFYQIQPHIRKTQKQWMFQLVRLCMLSSLNYVLRTVHPDHTVEAAKTLDEYLVDFVLKLTECKRKYDGIPDDREKQRIVDQILVQISRGGIGIQSSEDTRRMAYVGSWALTGQRVEMILGIEQMDQVRTDLAIHVSQMVLAGIVREGDLSVQSMFNQHQQSSQLQKELS